MLDAVVSFLWVDAAGNEVLLDADGTLNSSFVPTFRPFRFPDGWGIATPTSDKDFLGMCRAFGIDGHDDPRLQTIGERNQNREFVAEVMDAVLRGRGDAHHRRRDRRARGRDRAVRRGALAGRARRRPARARGRDVREPRPPGSRAGPPAPPPRAVRGHARASGRAGADARRAHRRGARASSAATTTRIAELRVPARSAERSPTQGGTRCHRRLRRPSHAFRGVEIEGPGFAHGHRTAFGPW